MFPYAAWSSSASLIAVQLIQVAQEVLGYTKSLMHVQEHKTQLMGLQQLLAKHHLPVQTSKSGGSTSGAHVTHCNPSVQTED